MLLSNVIVFILIYAFVVSVIGLIGYLSQQAKERDYKTGGILLEEVCLLIPFRDEEARIHVLLDSLNNSSELPGEILFIDDHSSDQTVQKIQQSLQNVNFSIISLPDGVTGKKAALRYAMTLTSATYLHTMDADVVFESNLFSNIQKLSDADMYILPAIMAPENAREYFYTIDLYLVNAINAGLTGLARPIIASGANLLYRKSTFYLVDNYISHAHSASGDDTYLLRDFRLNSTDVRLITTADFAVRTETPHSFKQMLDQRLRWVGKTSNMKDLLSSMVGLLQFVLTLAFFVLLIWGIIEKEWQQVLALIGLKSAVEWMSFYPFFSQTKTMKGWLFLPIYQFYFPVYSIILVVAMLVYKPTWKNRKIYKLEN